MRADRLISMLMLLQTRGRMTADELAERLEVSSRTVYRDLDALSAAGVPIYSERGPQGGIALLENYRTNLTGLTRQEVQALFMFTVPGLFTDLQVNKTQQAASLKLLAALPAPFRQDVELVRQYVHLDPAGWFQPAEPIPYLPLLQAAVWQQQRLRIVYRRGDGEWVKRLVDPYGLVAKAGVWYLVGAVSGHLYVYRVSRLQEAALADSRFERLETFDLAGFWADWCARFEAGHTTFKVALRLAPGGVSSLIEVFGEGIHPLLEQGGAVDADGWLRLSLTFESPEAACRQLLGLGPIIEVVSPQALRDRMLELSKTLVSLYGA
ncbi:MAG: YafY family protein [Chloroflexota bacterium]